MQSYRDLTVWQRSIQLVTAIYQLTDKFPKSEMFGLVSQMRRAAVSIAANLAEGYARKHRAEYIQFVRISYGSGAELETHLTVAENLRFATGKETRKSKELLDETMRMLNKLLTALTAKP